MTAYRLLEEEIYFCKGDTSKLKEEKLRKNEYLSTYLNVSITLDPPMQLPSENAESYRTGAEESNLLIKANEWRIKL